MNLDDGCLMKKMSVWLLSFFSFLIPLSPLSAAEQHAIAMHGDPKYPASYTHFDVVNPEAPKGGELKIAVVGTFDNLNPFILKGNSPAGIRDICCETLLKRSPDEPFTLYGLVAESLEVAPDRSWVIYNIHPKAKWKDGVPITAKDIEFSYKTFLEHGTPGQQMYYKRVEKAEVLGDRKIKFTFKKVDGKYDAEMPLIMGVMGIIAEHDLKDKEFEKTGLKPLLSSGPYKLEKVEPGRSIIYKKDPNHWSADLPVNKGYFNFETIRFDFYKNATVAFEAFKAGEIYVREESDPGKWTRNYDFPALQKGLVRKVEIPHQHQVGMQAFAFNTRRDIFKDSRVRRALAYAFDFDWVNEHMFYGELTRTTSFFDNTELAAKNLPEGEELALLEPYREQLPKEVFEEPYALPTFEKGFRENLKVAKSLLKDAGWVTTNGKLIHEETGQPFTFEILSNVPENEKLILAFVRNLKQLGIQATARTVDAAQYENRRVNRDYDMIMHFWGHSMSPGNEQSFYWSSIAADAPGTRNYPGVKDPVVDALCNKVVNAQTREDLVAAIKALDRTLLWGHYVIPLGHRTKDYVAYWNFIDHPLLGPTGLPSIHTLWRKDITS